MKNCQAHNDFLTIAMRMKLMLKIDTLRLESKPVGKNGGKRQENMAWLPSF